MEFALNVYIDLGNMAINLIKKLFKAFMIEHYYGK